MEQAKSIFGTQNFSKSFHFRAQIFLKEKQTSGSQKCVKNVYQNNGIHNISYTII